MSVLHTVSLYIYRGGGGGGEGVQSQILKTKIDQNKFVYTKLCQIHHS